MLWFLPLFAKCYSAKTSARVHSRWHSLRRDCRIGAVLRALQFGSPQIKSLHSCALKRSKPLCSPYCKYVFSAFIHSRRRRKCTLEAYFFLYNYIHVYVSRLYSPRNRKRKKKKKNHITTSGRVAGTTDTSVLGINLYFFAAILSTASGVNFVTPITG